MKKQLLVYLGVAISGFFMLGLSHAKELATLSEGILCKSVQQLQHAEGIRTAVSGTTKEAIYTYDIIKRLNAIGATNRLANAAESAVIATAIINTALQFHKFADVIPLYPIDEAHMPYLALSAHTFHKRAQDAGENFDLPGNFLNDDLLSLFKQQLGQFKELFDENYKSSSPHKGRPPEFSPCGSTPVRISADEGFSPREEGGDSPILVTPTGIHNPLAVRSRDNNPLAVIPTSNTAERKGNPNHPLPEFYPALVNKVLEAHMEEVVSLDQGQNIIDLKQLQGRLFEKNTIQDFMSLNIFSLTETDDLVGLLYVQVAMDNNGVADSRDVLKRLIGYRNEIQDLYHQAQNFLVDDAHDEYEGESDEGDGAAHDEGDEHEGDEDESDEDENDEPYKEQLPTID